MFRILSRHGALFIAFLLPAFAQVNVVTYQYDNTRAGQNLNEFLLTRGAVNVNQFGKLFSHPVDGQLYGQPLYVQGVNIAGKGFHNVVYAATEHDTVYAFDADTSTGANAAPLWQVSFLNGPGVTTAPASDLLCGQIDPEIGITGTPVIDLAGSTMYLVAMTKETGAGGASYVQRLHALDLTSGAERPGSPVVIQASVPGTGEGSNTVVFNPRNYKQRPGLLLLNGTVYTAWSSHCDIGVYHGWLIGYDARTLRRVTVYNNTPNGNEGSFWAGGAAPAADSAGNIFLAAGNGTFDVPIGGADLGESFIKLSSAGGLAVADYFTPFNFQELNDGDVDVGSSGVALLGDEAGSSAHPHLMVGAGKEGRLYVLDRDHPGKWQAGSDSQAVASVPGIIGGLFGNPAYLGNIIYTCAIGDSLKAFAISNATLTASAISQSQAAFGYPGCVPTISANGVSDSIVWLLEGSGTLHAYDASNLGRELYNTNQNGSRDALGDTVKFSVPTVANGKVYAGTQASLAVYGRMTSLTVANAASGQANIVAPGSIVTIYGAGLAQSTQSASTFPLPPTLGGAAISVNNVTGPMLYASGAQINAVVPFDTPVGGASITVNSGTTPAGLAGVVVQATAPGLFLLDGIRAAAVNQDNSVNAPDHAAPAGSFIYAYLTGLGAVDNPVPTGMPAPSSPLSRTLANVTATIGGASADVQFSGLAPGYAGLYQVNIVVPQLPPGEYPLRVFAGGVGGNNGTISIR
jgi:uncharacterized protein (TIGR03437 family)